MRGAAFGRGFPVIPVGWACIKSAVFRLHLYEQAHALGVRGCRAVAAALIMPGRWSTRRTWAA
jgi:hypothetical protein